MKSVRPAWAEEGLEGGLERGRAGEREGVRTAWREEGLEGCRQRQGGSESVAGPEPVGEVNYFLGYRFSISGPGWGELLTRG